MPYLTDLLSKGFDHYTMLDGVVMTAVSAAVSFALATVLVWVTERIEVE